MATHRIDRTKGLLPEVIAQQGGTVLERSLAQMRMCTGCGRFLHPKVWQEPCAWTDPLYRMEHMREIAQGTMR